MATILKAGNTILRTGSNIFLTGQPSAPVLDLDGETLGVAGSAIAQWNELGGNHAFQTLAASQPVVEVVGGKKCARFDGTDDHLLLTLAATVRTAFLVLECVNLAGSSLTPLFSSSSGDTQATAYFDGDNSTWFRNLTTPIVYGANPLDRLFVNGVRATPIHAQPKVATRHLLCLDAAGLGVPVTHLVRRAIGGGNSINMRLYKLLIYDKRLTDLERNTITQQLRTAYSI